MIICRQKEGGNKDNPGISSRRMRTERDAPNLENSIAALEDMNGPGCHGLPEYALESEPSQVERIKQGTGQDEPQRTTTGATSDRKKGGHKNELEHKAQL
jgi:hypothetical protein